MSQTKIAKPTKISLNFFRKTALDLFPFCNFAKNKQNWNWLLHDKTSAWKRKTSDSTTIFCWLLFYRRTKKKRKKEICVPFNYHWHDNWKKNLMTRARRKTKKKKNYEKNEEKQQEQCYYTLLLLHTNNKHRWKSTRWTPVTSRSRMPSSAWKKKNIKKK